MPTFKLKRGTAAQFTTANPVLADGEPGVEKDTQRFKIGDGVTAWSALPYYINEDQITTYVETSLADLVVDPPGAASETVAGIGEISTQAEMTTAASDVTFVTPLKYRTDADAHYQPLDGDLLNIAALTTTTYGRAFLALANQAGLQALLGLDTDVALAANSDAKIATQKAVKAYADGLLDANNAYVYKGGIDCSANPNYPAASAGHTYKVTVAGKIGGASGTNVEVGDTLTCLVDSTSAGTQAAVGANWLIVQTNIDGAVVGPASSTASRIVTFSGTTGKIIQDSGAAISTDGTFASNSDAKVPTEKAVKTYAASKQQAMLRATYSGGTAVRPIPVEDGGQVFWTVIGGVEPSVVGSGTAGRRASSGPTDAGDICSFAGS